MKITSVECYLGDFITVKVNTDEGISGFGEAGLAYGNCWEAAFGQCQDFAKLILGMDPFNTEEIWEHLHRHTFWGMGGGVVVTSAMAAIDTACPSTSCWAARPTTSCGPRPPSSSAAGGTGPRKTTPWTCCMIPRIITTW